MMQSLAGRAADTRHSLSVSSHKPARLRHHHRNDGEAEDHHIPTAGRAEIRIGHRVDRLVEDRADDRADEKPVPPTTAISAISTESVRPERKFGSTKPIKKT